MSEYARRPEKQSNNSFSSSFRHNPSPKSQHRPRKPVRISQSYAQELDYQLQKEAYKNLVALAQNDPEAWNALPSSTKEWVKNFPQKPVPKRQITLDAELEAELSHFLKSEDPNSSTPESRQTNLKEVESQTKTAFKTTSNSPKLDKQSLKTTNNKSDQQPPDTGIFIPSGTTEAVVGTLTIYQVNTGQHLEPRDQFIYQWTIINDSETLKQRDFGDTFWQNGLDSLLNPKQVKLPKTDQPQQEIEWDFPGQHTVQVEIYFQGQVWRTYQYPQLVQDRQQQAAAAFEKLAPAGLQPDVYLQWLETQQDLLQSSGASEKKLQQIEKALVNARDLLGITQDNPIGDTIPLKAILVPKAQPVPVPLQLYLSPLDETTWAIIDLTNPAPGKARSYEGEAPSNANRIVAPQQAILSAWQNYLDNNPHPAGQVVAEIPGLGANGTNTVQQGYSDGISTLGEIREWFATVRLITGLGALALTLAPIPGTRVAASVLVVTAGASTATAGGLNIADRIQHGNFQWDGETALDIVDIAGGLATGTISVISLASKAGNVTKLRNALLLGKTVEDSSDISTGVILSVQYYGEIEAIKQDNSLSPEEKQAAITQVLKAASLTGGLMVLGFVAGGGKNKVTEIDAPTTKPEIETTTTPTPEKQPTTSSVSTTKTPDLPNLTPESSLLKALPSDLQGKVTIEIDDSLTGSTVRVYYQPEVHIKVAPNTQAIDIELHVPTVRTLRKYAGLTGKVWALLERIYNWIARNGEPPVGSLAWEAKLELEKLPTIIAERQARLAAGDLDPDVRAELEAEIADLEKQIDYHTRTLDEIDVNPGVGYVAVEFTPDASNFATRVIETVEIIETRLQELPPSQEVSELSQQTQQLKVRNQEITTAEEKFILDENSTISAEDIEGQKQELIDNLDQIEAKLFHLSGKHLSSETSGLGSNGFIEYKQWYQDILDIEELLALNPELKAKYSSDLKGQKDIWLQVSQEAQSDSDKLYTIIKLFREDLTKIKNSITPQLIQQQTVRLNDIARELRQVNPEISKLTRQQRSLRQGGQNTSKIDAQLNTLQIQKNQLNAERNQLNQKIERIEQLQQTVKPNIEREKFAENVTTQKVWEILSKNHDTGKSSSSKKWARVLIAERIIHSEQEIVDYLATIKPQGKSVGEVRRQFKDHYRSHLLKIITKQPSRELKYQKMRAIAESLDVREQGEISEQWYQIEFAKDRGVSRSTQIALDTNTATDKYGIELSSVKNRRFDEVYGDENSATIREHKHITGKLAEREIAQFDDNIKIVQHNRSIDTKTAQGIPLTSNKQDTPVILEKDGKKYRPKKLIYTFATPEGVRANVKWMGTELRNNQRFLSFEIINHQGERKIVKYKNIEDLDEPALSQWLDSSSVSNSNMNF